MTVKKVYLFFSSLFLFFLHLPFVFAKTKSVVQLCRSNISDPVPVIADSCSVQVPLIESLRDVSDHSLYDSLKLGSMGLGRQAFDYAIEGFNKIKKLGTIENQNVISIVDFSKASNFKRLFVIDLKNYKVLFNTYVAHGVNSGKEFARQFSNIMESNQSSLGFYKTTDTYSGKHGYSLHLQGLEKGINDNAYRRDIVVHGADYVSESMIAANGCIGRSHGCPAIPEPLLKPIIDKIKNGTCLFIYGADRRYLSTSRLLSQNTTYSLAKN